MVVGEMTVILQDVVALQGLRIDGSAITGPVTCDQLWDSLREELLGLRPMGRANYGTSLRFSWLHKNFAKLPPQFFMIKSHWRGTRGHTSYVYLVASSFHNRRVIPCHLCSCLC
ncbi:PMD domain-containing protein [Cephalotus follicularis]|uniref:PMD domain-containing protein n=1 Tax=Cephalotus follicularis TaxID=3775 RepID=A0A1Q3C8Q4_CEPFO|nr:PMD domain-containing protein [Cephalotus follicularis]